ncbi:hypothetical protein NLI96_g5260 [Meripilus lineatus]|uniref:Deoxyuridine 5'-triphosphate nucleotidohydrolase n=1 Tax=Meripilus lineatus TaxID=2056292 RepID=A0AAD5V339_9APHY|nr:hypothetical protein NLI96_g5260 [Physisporinus lineatus]
MSDELQNKKRKTTSENGIETTVSESLPNLLVKRHSPNAKVPTRGSQLAAGYDLYRYTVSCSLRFDALDSSITLFFISAERKLIPAHGKALVNTQISIAVPPGTYGRVAPRSGLASKFMIDTGAGVIDADYRGIVFVLLYNLSDADFQVEEGDRIAQLILERIYTPEILEVENLDETVRGAGGFGSTGGHVAL